MEQNIQEQANQHHITGERRVPECPVCDGQDFIQRLSVVDRSITGEKFTVRSCRKCGFCHTHPQPDENNIGRYYASDEYVSHSETRAGIINKLYGFLQKYNLRYKHRLLSKIVPRGTWLDYGAGAGAFMAYCKQKNIDIIGLEPDEPSRNKASAKGLEIYSPSHIAAFQEGEFAAITMWHVLEHVHQLNALLAQAHRILKPGGILTIAVPNLLSYDAHHYKEFWAAYDVPRHLWHFREKDVRGITIPHGFEFRSKHPLKLDAFYVSMLSEKYMKGNLLRGIWIGLRSNFHARFSAYPYSSEVYVFKKSA